MCVVGKYMLKKFRIKFINSINTILKDNTQEQVFIPEVVGLLSDDQWEILQACHDAIAKDSLHDLIRLLRVNDILFSLQELVNHVVIDNNIKLDI